MSKRIENLFLHRADRADFGHAIQGLQGGRLLDLPGRSAKDSYVLRGAGQNGIIDQGTMPTDDRLWSFTAPTTNASPAGTTTRK